MSEATGAGSLDAERLLGPARMVLDRIAVAYGDEEAERMAQRIVDVIGHPVTDEPPTCSCSWTTWPWR